MAAPTPAAAVRLVRIARDEYHRPILESEVGVGFRFRLDRARRKEAAWLTAASRKDIIYVEEIREPAHVEPSPSKALRREERLSRLEKALDSLSPEQREVIALVRIEGLKIKEAAGKMNRTPNAAMKLLTRALKKLKDIFGDTDSLHLPPRGLAAGDRRGHDA